MSSFKKRVFQWVLWGAWAFGFATGHAAFAQQSILEIKAQQEQKATLVRYFRETIRRHESMTKEEIVRDYEDRLNAQRKRVGDLRDADALKAFDRGRTASLDELHGLTQSQILGREKLLLQQLLSSDNIMFFLTKNLVRYPGEIPTFVQAIFMIVTLPVDLGMLPATFIYSAATGF